MVEYGLIPELVGRVPVLAPLRPLDVESLVKVLSEPRNAIVRQYQKLFEMENAELEFTEESLRAVAHKAYERQTGARGLRSIIEELMLDVMFELPEQGAGRRYVVTPEVVYGKQPLFAVSEPKHKSA